MCCYWLPNTVCILHSVLENWLREIPGEIFWHFFFPHYSFWDCTYIQQPVSIDIGGMSFILWDTFYVSPILLPQYTPFCLFHQRSCAKLQAISAWHFSAIATVWCLILWSVDFYTGHRGTGILGIMLIYLEHRFGL